MFDPKLRTTQNLKLIILRQLPTHSLLIFFRQQPPNPSIHLIDFWQFFDSISHHIRYNLSVVEIRVIAIRFGGREIVVVKFGGREEVVELDKL